MNAMRVLSEYLRLSDIMYQALKVSKFEIFESAMEERRTLLNSIPEETNIFEALNQSEKEYYRSEIKTISSKIERAMSMYRKNIENELKKVHASRANLRRQSKAKKYFGSIYESQGNFIDKLR